MVKSLLLSNFKTHKDTRIEFSPGVNVIVGPSDAGKSNIIRAISWIASNRPLSDNVIRKQQDQAMACLIIANGDKDITITRNRSRKKGNEYVIENSDGLKDSLTAFGSDVPQVVIDSLNLSDINIQKQFAPYFLVFDPPGQVAEYIRSITKLDEIDKVIDSISGRSRKTRDKLSICQSSIEEVNNQLDELSKIDIDKLEAYITRAKSIQEKNFNLGNTFTRLTSIINQLVEVEKCTINLPQGVDQLINKVKNESNVSAKLRADGDKLIKIIESLATLESSKVSIPESINETLNVVTDLRRKYNNLLENERLLKRLINELEGINKSISQLDKDIIANEGDRQSLLNQLTVCPSCGAELTKESKNFLLKGENQ